MKLNEIRPNVETSGDLEEQFFSIEDQGMIFDILRNKMYSNPILAICREISCNARDAHREVGKPEVPIHIHLPTSLEPYYKIKDFGLGISPDRMSNIFIKYTASTKRNDDVQTGGFGLGAKTPFSYSDSFAITTNVNGRQYHYTCFIDPTKVGKLALNHEAPTKEPNGTEIQIPVLPKDFTEFRTWTEQACRHWEVKPIIKGGTIEWQKNQIIISGNKWEISNSGSWNRSAKMVIDGIEYPLEIDVLRKYADTKLIDASRGDFVLQFGVGELSLSANREQIYLDKKTQGLIRDRLKAIVDELKERVSEKIEAYPDLLQANVYYRKELRSVFSNLGFLGKLSWHGIDLHDDYIRTNCSVFHFQKGKYTRRGNSDPDKISRSINKHLQLEEKSELYINDLPLREPTSRHIKKAFENNPDVKSVQIICPNDKVTVADLDKSINLNLMDPKLLSSIAKVSARTSTYTPTSSRLLVFKFEPGSYAFRQVSYSSMEEDTNNKILCSLTKDSSPCNRRVVLKNNKYLSNDVIKKLTSRFQSHSFYGVDCDTPAKRIQDDLSGMIDINQFIEKKVLNDSFDYLEFKYAEEHISQLDEKTLRQYKDIESLLAYPNSFYLQRLRAHQKVRELYSKNNDLLSIFEAINGDISAADIEKFVLDHPHYDLERINQEYQNTYPLIQYLYYYDYDKLGKHLADYINMIDAKFQEKKNV